MKGNRFCLVFVIPDLRIGGAERHAATLLCELAARGHRVAIVCIEAGGPMAHGLAEAGVTVVELALGTAWKWRMLASGSRVAHALHQLAPDVVMTSGYSAEVLTRLVLRGRADQPLLSWKHNIGHLGRFGVRDRLTERVLGRWVTRYLAVSYTQVGYLRGYLRLDPARIVVLRNAIELLDRASDVERATTRRELGVAGEQVIIGCVAVLRSEKDHATLIKALALLPKSSMAVLVLVGDGPLRENLAELARAKGLAERVRFLGTREDVPRLLATFDVAVLASQTVENLPYAALEAMASGLPVVSTAVGAMAELIDDGVTGWLIPPRSPTMLADRLSRLIYDAGVRARMGEAARERVTAGFQLTQLVSATEREVREVIRDGRHCG